MGPDGSWTTPVQYRYKKRLELSFVSLMGAKHVANILRDSRVSAAIHYPEQFASGGSLGLQLKGKATHESAEGRVAARLEAGIRKPIQPFFRNKLTACELWSQAVNTALVVVR